MNIQLRIGPELISSYRRLAYTPWHAIAEFVDNSTQSFFDNEGELLESYARSKSVLEVAIVYDREKQRLRIADNAMGMSFDELQHALHLAKPPANPTGRSRYGMGLKTAACWIGNVWTIRTKKKGEIIEHQVVVDVEKVASGSLELEYRAIERSDPNLHFTVIEIAAHNQVFHGRTLGKIKTFLRSMYREDFRRKRLKLMWDDELLTWEDDPNRFLVDPEGEPYRKDFDFKVGTRSVTGWVGYLERGSREEAGFSIIHCGRVVRGYPDSWRPSSLYGQAQGTNDLVNQRLVGEIHLDEFEVSHTKDNILWLGHEDEVEDKLRDACGDYRERAQQYRKRGDDRRGPSQVETDTAVSELRKELESPEIVNHIHLELVPPQAVVEESVRRVAESIVQTHSETCKARIGDLLVRVYTLPDMSPNDHYVTVDARDRHSIFIIVNQAHPHWAHLKGSDGVLNYLRHCVYDGLAEWQARHQASRIDPDTIKALKDKLLRLPLEIERHSSQLEK